jgi:hypothetical protein
MSRQTNYSTLTFIADALVERLTGPNLTVSSLLTARTLWLFFEHPGVEKRFGISPLLVSVMTSGCKSPGFELP